MVECSWTVYLYATGTVVSFVQVVNLLGITYRTPKFKGGYQRPGQTLAGGKGPSKGIDIEAVGTINGQSVYEFDLDSISERDRPWRKPGKYF